MKVVITIPAYNEEGTLGQVLEDINEVMKKTSYKYELLVVDDGSKDNTAEIARRLGAAVISHPKNYGLASTFRTEMKACLDMNADIIVHTDADGQYRAEDIPTLIKTVEEGYDLVLGSRFKGRIEYMPLIKRLGNIGFSKVISQVTKSRISDGQTGFRAFTKNVARDITITSDHTYTQEQIIKAVREKFRFKEVPVHFLKRRHGQSRLMKSPFEYAFRAWINIFRIYRDYEPIRFFGFFGFLFLGIGTLIGLFFVYLHFTSGIRGHLGLLILMMLLIISGIQITLFGFFADMNRK
jgi:glycosyltransferase involved in cell wall biosynthesis